MPILRFAITAAATAALATAGVAVAQDAAGPDDTVIRVSPPAVLVSPAPSPADFPGIQGDAPGRPLARGAVVVSHRVTITIGRRDAHPAFTVACPAGKVLRTFAGEPGGDVFPQLVGQTPVVRERSFDYIGKQRWAVLGDFNRRATDPGDTITGQVHGYCR